LPALLPAGRIERCTTARWRARAGLGEWGPASFDLHANVHVAADNRDGLEQVMSTVPI